MLKNIYCTWTSWIKIIDWLTELLCLWVGPWRGGWHTMRWAACSYMHVHILILYIYIYKPNGLLKTRTKSHSSLHIVRNIQFMQCGWEALQAVSMKWIPATSTDNGPPDGPLMWQISEVLVVSRSCNQFLIGPSIKNIILIVYHWRTASARTFASCISHAYNSTCHRARQVQGWS